MNIDEQHPTIMPTIKGRTNSLIADPAIITNGTIMTKVVTDVIMDLDRV